MKYSKRALLQLKAALAVHDDPEAKVLLKKVILQIEQEEVTTPDHYWREQLKKLSLLPKAAEADKVKNGP